jgi:hypothetical protein
MARIRSIKPEFWSDDSVLDCSPLARLMFIGTWNFADDAGNMDRSAKQLKTRIFPVDDIDCEPLVLELLTHGLLIEYSVSGKKYLHIPGFADHQIINRPSKPVVPTYQESLRTPGALTEGSMSTHDGGEGRGRKGGEGKGIEGRGETRAVDNPGDEAPSRKPGARVFSGESSPPEDPPSRRVDAAARRNGDFEAINDAISKVLAAGVCQPSDTTLLAKMAGVTETQAATSVRQLRDRGRLPTGVAA